MSDEAAIRLFVEDGGLAHEWHCVDQSVRNYWLKKALEKDEQGGSGSALFCLSYKSRGPRNPSPT